MSRTVYFDVNKEVVAEIANQMSIHHDDRVLVLAPVTGKASTHAPSKTGKHKGHYRFKFEVWIPEEAIKGWEAITEFGIITLMTIPKNRVEDHLLSNGEDAS